MPDPNEYVTSLVLNDSDFGTRLQNLVLRIDELEKSAQKATNAMQQGFQQGAKSVTDSDGSINKLNLSLGTFLTKFTNVVNTFNSAQTPAKNYKKSLDEIFTSQTKVADTAQDVTDAVKKQQTQLSSTTTIVDNAEQSHSELTDAFKAEGEQAEETKTQVDDLNKSLAQTPNQTSPQQQPNPIVSQPVEQIPAAIVPDTTEVDEINAALAATQLLNAERKTAIALVKTQIVSELEESAAVSELNVSMNSFYKGFSNTNSVNAIKNLFNPKPIQDAGTYVDELKQKYNSLNEQLLQESDPLQLQNIADDLKGVESQYGNFLKTASSGTSNFIAKFTEGFTKGKAVAGELLESIGGIETLYLALIPVALELIKYFTNLDKTEQDLNETFIGADEKTQALKSSLSSMGTTVDEIAQGSVKDLDKQIDTLNQTLGITPTAIEKAQGALRLLKTDLDKLGDPTIGERIKNVFAQFFDISHLNPFSADFYKSPDALKQQQEAKDYQAIQSKIAEEGSKQRRVDTENDFKAQTETNTAAAAFKIKQQIDTNTKLADNDKKSNADRLSALQDSLNKQKQLNAVNKNIDLNGAGGDIVKTAAINEKYREADIQAQSDYDNKKASLDDKANTNAERANKEAQRLNEQRLKNEQDAANLLLSLQKQLRDAEAKGIDDLTAGKIAVLQSGLGDNLAQLDSQQKVIEQKQKLYKNDVAAQQDYTNSLEVISKLRVQLTQNEVDAEKKILQEAAMQQIELQLTAQQTILSNSKDSLDKQLQLIDIGVQKQIKSAEKQFSGLNTGDATATAAEQAAIVTSIINKGNQNKLDATFKYDKTQLDEEKKTQDTLLNLASEYGDKSTKAQEQLNQAKLELQLQYDKQLAELLIADNTGQNDEQLKQVYAEIAAIEGALKKGKAKIKDDNQITDGVSFLSFLGIDTNGLSDPDKQLIDQTLSSIAANTTNFFNQLADDRIAAKQKEVDGVNDLISKETDNLNKQLDLQKQGYASDVSASQARLAALQAQRTRDNADLKKAQKEKELINKAELLSDTAVQLSNMITATTKIYNAFASIPVVGVPLAIAAITLMYASFAASKILAFKDLSNAGSDSTSHAEGGEIEGKSHATGGEKYMHVDKTGNKHVKELEAGEYVTKKIQFQKYKRVVEAINNNTVNNLTVNEVSFQTMLKEMGIALPHKEVTEATTNYEVHHNYHNISYSTNNNNIKQDMAMKSIDKNIQYLAEQEKNKEVVEFENEHVRIVRKGNTRTQINKNKKA